MSKIRMVCADCGSTKIVLQDAYVSWNVELQKWCVINAEHCDGYCELCHEEGEIKQEIIDEPITPSVIAVPATLAECQPDQVRGWWAGVCNLKEGIEFEKLNITEAQSHCFLSNNCKCSHYAYCTKHLAPTPKTLTLTVPTTLNECRPDQVVNWWAAYVSSRGK